MKKPQCAQLCSYIRECVLITLFQLYDSETGLFEDNLLWMDQYHPSTFILEEEIYQY